MIVDHDSDDGSDQRGNAEGEPPEPPSPAAAISRDVSETPSISVDSESAVDVEREVAEWLADGLTEAISVARPAGGRRERVLGISVRILGDRSMARAHRRWCDVEGTTDVLTFASAEPEGLHIDLMLCIDEARRRAEEFGHDERRELLLYAVHGLLHGLGHDDQDAEAFASMHDEEDRILRQIGVGSVFRPEGAS